MKKYILHFGTVATYMLLSPTNGMFWRINYLEDTACLQDIFRNYWDVFRRVWFKKFLLTYTWKFFLDTCRQFVRMEWKEGRLRGCSQIFIYWSKIKFFDKAINACELQIHKNSNSWIFLKIRCICLKMNCKHLQSMIFCLVCYIVTLLA